MVEHLRRHGASVEGVWLQDIPASSIVDAVQHESRKRGADMIIAGAFGHFKRTGAVALVYKPRLPLIDAGIVAMLLLLGGACTSVQNTREPESVAHVRVAADAELVARVKAALHADPYVNDTHIEVIMENGNVVLTGLVEDNGALLDAVQIANKAADGRKVIDALSIMKTSAH
jgi:hypothetical protein